MCGIVGFVGRYQANREELLNHSMECIAHRGPDGGGVYIDDKAAIGHRQLAVLDQEKKANQPFVHDESNVIISYNGEIYNYLGLRRELEANGFRFKSETDTEVILAAYLAWGHNCVERFEGMFAFCIYDQPKGKLFLARDIFGEKPLYYSNKNGFSFCSELGPYNGVLTDRNLSVPAMNHFLAIGYVLNPLTIYEDVYCLPPAGRLTYDLSTATLTISEYFNYSDHFRNKHKLTLVDAVDQLGTLLNESIKETVSQKLDFGLFLSGGLDSSTVAQQLACNDFRFRSYTADFGRNSIYDESEKAVAVANQLGIEIERVKVEPTSQELEHFLSTLDYATFDNSSFPLFKLASAAKKHGQYVLSGDGADELFGGYVTQKADQLNSKYAIALLAIRPALIGLINRLDLNQNDKVGTVTKVERFVRGMNKDYRRAHFNWRLIFNLEERIRILGEENADLILESDPFHVFKKYYAAVQDLVPLEQHLFVDTQTWLTDNILVRSDRSTMKAGLEMRSPFLNKRLAIFMARCPAEFKTGKRLLKRAMQSRLPKGTVHQPKTGFNSPIVKWMKTQPKKDEFKFFTQHVFNLKYAES